MYKTIKFNKSKTRAVLYEYDDLIYKESKKNNDDDLDTRIESSYGSESYERGLRRAFNNAKVLAFFNPDLTRFVTLTYHDNVTDPAQAIHDIKMMIKHHKRRGGADFKYIYVLELQKRGAVHIHMICNDVLQTSINKYGYEQIDYWANRHGFTNVKKVEDTDRHFKPYLYLFKYMYKSHRVGKSFIHTSRNLDRPSFIDDGYEYQETISNAKVAHQEYHEVIIDGDYKHAIKKTYLEILPDAWEQSEQMMSNIRQLYRQPQRL